MGSPLREGKLSLLGQIPREDSEQALEASEIPPLKRRSEDQCPELQGKCLRLGKRVSACEENRAGFTNGPIIFQDAQIVNVVEYQ